MSTFFKKSYQRILIGLIERNNIGGSTFAWMLTMKNITDNLFRTNSKKSFKIIRGFIKEFSAGNYRKPAEVLFRFNTVRRLDPLKTNLYDFLKRAFSKHAFSKTENAFFKAQKSYLSNNSPSQGCEKTHRRSYG